MADKQKQRWRKIFTIFTFVALVVLIILTREQIVDTFKNIGEVKASFLIFMVVFQIWNYHAYTKLYQSLFQILGNKFKYRDLYKVSVELNFVNHVFPSAGLSGFSYFSIRMKQLGAPVAKSTFVQVMRFVTVFISFQVLLLFGVLMLAIGGKANDLTILVASSIGTLLFVGTGLSIYIVGDRKRIDTFFTFLTKILNRLIHFVRPKHPETISIKSARSLFIEIHENYKLLQSNFGQLKKPLYFSFIANATEVATIYVVYIAFDQLVNPGAVILAYAVANFAGLISVLPGGIGVYEALTAAVLATAGVPVAVGIPVTVMYRVLSMLIQLPPGYYFYQKALVGENNQKKNDDRD